MLVKVRVIHLRLVPKSLVVRQIGGARQCWMVVVTMLRSNDWNAHLPEVPPAGEDPPPPDGIPHPLHGEGLNAEQLYQQQLHTGWLRMQWLMLQPMRMKMWLLMKVMTLRFTLSGVCGHLLLHRHLLFFTTSSNGWLGRGFRLIMALCHHSICMIALGLPGMILSMFLQALTPVQPFLIHMC